MKILKIYKKNVNKFKKISKLLNRKDKFNRKYNLKKNVKKIFPNSKIIGMIIQLIKKVIVKQMKIIMIRINIIYKI